MSPREGDFVQPEFQTQGADPGVKGHPPGGRCWPLPGVERSIPPGGEPGSFWEDRGDRRHAGMDIYAPAGSRVVAMEDGRVLSAGLFTSPDLAPYWNRTFQVTIAHVSGIFCRYAELGDLMVEKGSFIRGGEVIGHVGEVLNLALIGERSPPYIRSLGERGRSSMLHIEMFTSPPVPAPEYRGGNWFSRERPIHLIDPALVLRDAV